MTSPRVLVSPPCVVGNRATLREFVTAFADEFEIVVALLTGRRAEEKAGRIRKAIFEDRALKLIDILWRQLDRVDVEIVVGAALLVIASSHGGSDACASSERGIASGRLEDAALASANVDLTGYVNALPSEDALR